MSKFYAGIGSRQTPPDVLDLMTEAARWLRTQDWTLRSGHATGADWAFEQGAEQDSVIYLPWKTFGQTPYQDDPGRPVLGRAVVDDESADAGFEHLVELGIRRPGPVKNSLRKLHGRNVAQVLGLPGEKHSAFVLCWCPYELDQPTGGTATAIKLAEHYKIPVSNLWNEIDRALVEKKIGIR